MDLAIASLDEPRAEFLRPPNVAKDRRTPGLLAGSSALSAVPHHDGTDAPALPVPHAKTSDPARSPGPEIESVRSGGGEVGRLGAPEDGRLEDHAVEGDEEGRVLGGANVGTVLGVVNGKGEVGGGPVRAVGDAGGGERAVGGAVEEVRVVGDSDGEEAHGEDGEALRVGALRGIRSGG